MPSVLFELKDNVGVITLNRPEKMNAFTRNMSVEMQDILRRRITDKQIRAVYLTGNGRGFCAGQDLSDLQGMDAPPFDKLLAEFYDPVVTGIRNLALPVVCGVNGVAAGAGANLALCADIVVAAANASFIQAFTKIGLIPDSGGTYLLPRLVGLQKATALMMLGEKLSAVEAERWGLIYKVFPDEGFTDAAFSLARQLAQMPTRALAYTKQALQASLDNNLPQQLQLEARLQRAAGETNDYREGLSAFLEKRSPNFTGE